MTVMRIDTCAIAPDGQIGCRLDFATSTVLLRCGLHRTQTFAEIHLENQLKNIAIRALVTALASLGISDESVAWRFDEQRRVIITAPPLTNQQRNAIRNQLRGLLAEFNISDLNIDRVIIETV